MKVGNELGKLKKEGVPWQDQALLTFGRVDGFKLVVFHGEDVGEKRG